MQPPSGESKALSLTWKIYAWIYLFLVVFAVLPGFAVYPFNFWHTLRTLISFTLILGVFGYAYSRPLSTRGFWKIFFFVAVIDEFIDVPDLIHMSQPERAVSLMSYAIVLPCFFGVYFYTFKSEFIWEKKKPSP